MKRLCLLLVVSLPLLLWAGRLNAQLQRMTVLDTPEFFLSGMNNSEYTVLDSSDVSLVYRFNFAAFEGDTALTGADRMLLIVGDECSKYFSERLVKIDNECAEHADDVYFARCSQGGEQGYEVFTFPKESKMVVTNRLPIDLRVVRYEESLPKIKWEMGSETREILGHVCFSATARLFGRDYKAWFTPEIPVSIGPWKLHGLPGAVLLAEDSEHLFRFECIGISAQKEAIKMYKWDYDDKSKAEYLKFERDMYLHAGEYVTSSSYNVYIFDNSEKGYHKLSEDWSAYYCPLEISE